MAAVQRPLHDFFRALRDSDVHVSPADAIDASRAAAHVGYADRRLLRDALCVTLAKSEEEVQRFEACFDTFFARWRPPPAAREPAEPPSGAPPLVRQLLEGDFAGLDQAMETAAGRVGVGAIRLDTQRALFTRRLLDEMGLRGLETLIHAVRASGDARLAERLVQARGELFARGRAFVDREGRLHAGEAGRRLREALLTEQSFAAIAPEDLRAMETLVRRMARRLATKYARKRRRARRGRLDVRRTVARSLAHGGVPFEVAWKSKVVHKPKIVVLCDVSRSVASTAAFLLLFLHSLAEAVERLDAYAFSDRLVPVDDLLDQDGVDDAITLILARIGFRPTDYGRALADFREAAGAGLDRRTTVIVLGDGRSNRADPRLDLMREIADRARAVIWLNPEPETYWGQGDSEMHAYRRFCTLAKTCNTLKGLERIVDDVLRTYLPR